MVDATNNQTEASETKVEKVEAKNNPIDALKIGVEKFDFSELRAKDSNEGATFGKATFLDFNRMNFVINEKTIDSVIIKAFKKGAGDEEFKDFKVDKEFERFYNAGRRVNHLLTQEDYRSLAKEIFREIFTYAGAKIPNDSILEELVTNCNQAGYVGSLLGDESKPLTKISFENGLSFQSVDYTVCINCDNETCATIQVQEPISVRTMENPQEELHMNSTLQFTLKSTDDKHVTYKDGTLSLTIPEELKNHQKGDKNLFDILKEYLKQFCEKLGFKFEIKEEAKIEPNLGDPLTVKSYIKNVKPPVHVNNDKSPENGIEHL